MRFTIVFRRSGAVCNANHDSTAASGMRITMIFPHQGGGKCGRVTAIRGGQGGGPGGPTTKDYIWRLMDSPHEIRHNFKSINGIHATGGGRRDHLKQYLFYRI